MAESPVMIDQDPMDADWLRRLPPEIDSERKLYSWLQDQGFSLQGFFQLPMCDRAIEEGATWLEELKKELA